MSQARVNMDTLSSTRLPPPPYMATSPSIPSPPLLPSNPYTRVLNSHLGDLYTEIQKLERKLNETNSEINSLITQSRETLQELIEARSRLASGVDDESDEYDDTSEDEADGDDEDSDPSLGSGNRPRPGTPFRAHRYRRVGIHSPEVEETHPNLRGAQNRNLRRTLQYYSSNNIGSDGVDEYGRLWMDFCSDADEELEDGSESEDNEDSEGSSADIEINGMSWRTWLNWRRRGGE